MRVPWEKNIPVFAAGPYKRDWEAVPEGRKATDMRPGLADHRDFTRAHKEGDIDAALRVVRDSLEKSYIAMMKMQIQTLRAQGRPDPIIVVPYKEGSQNMLDRALAVHLSKELGLKIDTNVVRTDTESRKSMSPLQKLFTPATFAGAPEEGTLCIGVDDLTSTGSTMAGVRGHLKQNGSDLVMVAVLATPDVRLAPLNATPQQVSAVESNLSSLYGRMRDVLGFGADSLTRFESNLLTRQHGRRDLANHLVGLAT